MVKWTNNRWRHHSLYEFHSILEYLITAGFEFLNYCLLLSIAKTFLVWLDLFFAKFIVQLPAAYRPHNKPYQHIRTVRPSPSPSMLVCICICKTHTHTNTAKHDLFCLRPPQAVWRKKRRIRTDPNSDGIFKVNNQRRYSLIGFCIWTHTKKSHSDTTSSVAAWVNDVVLNRASIHNKTTKM